jgi:hypothetical protein
MRFRRSFLVAAFPLVVGSLHARTAVAQTQDPSALTEEERKNSARTLGEEGQKALDAKDYPRAEQLFRDATNLFPAATLSLGLARAQAQLGKVVGATENYNKIIREWGNHPSPPPAFKAALESAQAEIGDVQKRIANVTIAIDGAPPGAKVSLDDKPFPNSLLGLKRQVDPGTHVVKATADGYKVAEASFNVTDAGSTDVRLTMEKDPNAGVVAQPQPGPARGTSDVPPPKSSQKTYALVAFGVGGAGLVLGTVGGLLALGKSSSLKDTCKINGSKCPASAQSDIDSYQTMGTLSTVGFIVAGVGGAAGAVLLLTAPKAETKGATVSPYVGAGNMGVTGTF